MFSPEIWDVIESLPNELESEHFIIRFGDRNPQKGRGLGVNGVRDRVLILTYLQALENLHRTMRSPPWNWPEPLTDPGGKTRVFVCDEDPATSYDDERFPCIVLASRSDEPTTHAELLRAAAEAVHEATHVFTFTKRPHYETSSNPWIWFDEGLAVLMETLVAAGNPDYFRFLRNWIDVPETPLDESDEKYHSGIFVGYLHRRLGPDFVRDVWINSLIGEGPVEALEREAMHRNLTFLSADPGVRDIFASGYCVDPFFMSDHRSIGLAPDIFFRFGERAISQSFTLELNNVCEVKDDSLNHLSCRYYKFNLPAAATTATIEMTVDSVFEPQLKGEIAIVNSDKQRQGLVPLESATPFADGDNRRFRAVLSPIEKGIDLVLVISNCGRRTSTDNDDGEHDDDVFYSIRASAE